MTFSRCAVLIIPWLLGGWLLFDGSRALTVGDYVTPRSGPNAGQLGPWKYVVSAVGLDPRSTVVKSIHVGLGAAWIVGVLLALLRPALGWWALLAASACTVWYLPIGTTLSLIELVLLFLPAVRLGR